MTTTIELTEVELTVLRQALTTEWERLSRLMREDEHNDLYDVWHVQRLKVRVLQNRIDHAVNGDAFDFGAAQ